MTRSVSVGREGLSERASVSVTVDTISFPRNLPRWFRSIIHILGLLAAFLNRIFPQQHRRPLQWGANSAQSSAEPAKNHTFIGRVSTGGTAGASICNHTGREAPVGDTKRKLAPLSSMLCSFLRDHVLS